MATITTEEWRAELDRVAAMIEDNDTIEAGRGFTAQELAVHIGRSRSNTSERIVIMEREGKVRFIGYRKGTHRAKVYEVVQNGTPAAQ
jgi:hypothetical protein